MKLTINLDGEFLDRVVQITGSSTKTEAIHFALREVDRRARFWRSSGRGWAPALTN